MSGATFPDGTVPDPPFDPPETALESKANPGLPLAVQGQVGGDTVKLSWRARMRWLDDGGR